MQNLIQEFDRISLNCISLTEELCQKEAFLQKKINDFNILRKENNSLSKTIGDLNIELVNVKKNNEKLLKENSELMEIGKKE